MKKSYKVAAILLIVQGGVMEFAVFVGVIPLLALGVQQDQISEHFSFIVPYLQDNLYLMMVMSGVFGAVRLFGAIGVLRNRMWGLALSIINCVVTMALMIFLLPAGILDGIFSCTALILLLTGFFGAQTIVSDPETDAAAHAPATLATHGSPGENQ
ncbi:hypothetical protein E3T55_08610 [Cryobacterium frigoriphilum]|uniref:DUF2127 domain-containing protein n=1 Tax=Cryobacterium frigoriphilum TaxID=1259150 RepID=A0A4R9A1L8_9MICO|nr:hypothetical protein [Cryobacterium frigoriphilum]TFD50487.1 hypothetical protein E3T55_08610 [Cryobacterium frigoriphilum]